MIPQDSLRAITATLLSERITYRGDEISALNKILNDVQAELNSQRLATRVTLVPKPEAGPRAAVKEDFQATG